MGVSRSGSSLHPRAQMPFGASPEQGHPRGPCGTIAAWIDCDDRECNRCPRNARYLPPVRRRKNGGSPCRLSSLDLTRSRDASSSKSVPTATQPHTLPALCVMTPWHQAPSIGRTTLELGTRSGSQELFF